MNAFEYFIAGWCLLAAIGAGIVGLRLLKRSHACARVGNAGDAARFRKKALREGVRMLIAWLALCILLYSIYRR